MKPDPVRAVVDDDARTVTVAVTFQWAPPSVLALDSCEVGGLLGSMRRALTAWLTEPDGWGAGEHPVIEGFTYECYDVDEDRRFGYMPDYDHAVCAGCGKPVRWATVWWSAPTGWEHVEPISADEPCDRQSGRSIEPIAVVFPNRLAVDLTTQPQNA